MKYDDFKIFKFSTISKKINRMRDNFSEIYKKVKPFPNYAVNFLALILKYIFSLIYKSVRFVIYDFLKIYKNINFKINNIFKIYRYFDFRRYNFSKAYRYFDIKKFKYVPVYIAGAAIFSSLIYLSIPIFFTYEKSNLEKVMCKGLNIECSIQGKIRYSFFPSPRIKIEDLIIQDFIDKKRTLGKIKNSAIKLSLYNLANKNKLNFTKIELENAEINFNLHELKEYRNFSKKKFNSKPLKLKNAEIQFFDGEKNIAVITGVNFKYKTNNNVDDLILTGDLLNDEIYIKLKNKKKKNSLSTNFILKFLDTKTKINVLNSDLNKNNISGNISFKKNKNRLTSIFEYKDDQIIFKKSNLKNDFLDGKFTGILKFLPYFDFNLSVDLNGINFNRLHNTLIALNKENKKDLFKISKKINGELNLSAEKIFSRHTLINSFESRIRFVNGDILIEQLLLNLKKLGAADVTGVIKNDRNFTNFRFENNIFLDNLKRFYNKFGIYNKKNISSHLYVSGNLDLVNLNMRLNEIFVDKKFTEEDVAYIEKEFNDFLLEDGYSSLFNFNNLKEFIQLIVVESN